MEPEAAIAFTDTLVFAKVGVHLSDLQQAILRASWSWDRQSYDQIAEAYGYSATYLKHDVGPKLWKLLSEVLEEKVNKTSFRAAIERRFQAERDVQPTTPVPVSNETEQIKPTQPVVESVGDGDGTSADMVVEDVVDANVAVTIRQDWGEAIDTSCFYGRESELAQLNAWIRQDRCRLLALLGMGGMGKTALSVKLAQKIINSSETEAFEFIIWRSVRNAPSCLDFLADLLQSLSQWQPSVETTATMRQLLHYLQRHRCLLVLDNVETVLQGSDASAYEQLLHQIGETVHQSCVVLTSREKPRAVAVLEGPSLPVRSMQLSGLSIKAGQELFQLKGEFQATPSEWQQLIEGYSGNPLALKIISTTIQTLFAGNIADFLQQQTFVFGSIRSLIQQQFERLSATEKTVIYWLAINREPTAFAELRANIFPTVSSPILIEVLESLEYRSLIEKNAGQFSLQPVVMEYAIECLVKQVAAELQSDWLQSGFPTTSENLLCNHALLKTQSKDYIRETQIRLILQPILANIPSESLETTLLNRLFYLRSQSTTETGYAAGNLLNLLFQIHNRLQNCDLSSLKIWQADFRTIHLQNVNLANSDLRGSIFAETLGIVFAVAFSPNGILATGDAEGGLRLWQPDGTLLFNLVGHLGWVWSVVFSRDGSKLASCSSDKTIRVWDVQTGKCLQVLQGHSGSIWALAFSPEGKILASGGDEAAIKLWDIQTGACVQTLAGHTGPILSLAFADTAHILASGSGDGTVRLWDVETGEHRILQGHSNRVWSVAFSPDGHTLASGSADSTIRLWQRDGTQFRTLKHDNRVRSVAFSSDGSTLASSSDDQTVQLWDMQSGECLSVSTGHSNTIFSVTFSPNGQIIASGSADQTVRFWQAATGRCLKTVKGYTNSIFSLAFSPDEHTLASGSTDHTIRLWNLASGECQLLRGHQGWVTSVAFHPQADWIASASVDQTVRLWSVSRQQCLKTFQGHLNWVQSVAFSPDGELLASGGDDRTIRLWSVKTGQCLKTLAGHASWVWSVKFSPDGRLLASSSDDQTIRLWSVETGECLSILAEHTGQIQSIAFSLDGSLLASGSGDETVRLWSVSSGKGLKVLHGHDNNVWTVAFSPDGKMVASGSLDQTVRLWNVSSGACLQTLAVSNRSVRSSIAFSPIFTKSTYTLATGSHGGMIQLWDTATGEVINTLMPARPYQNTNITGVTGLTEAQKQALKALGAVEAESWLQP